MESPTLQLFLPQPLRQRLRRLASEGNQQNLLGRNMLLVDEIAHLSHRRHRLSAPSAANYQYIIFQ